jgi:putative toxin-antitoxin system antitoxin component (TIGR02293 family)
LLFVASETIICLTWIERRRSIVAANTLSSVLGLRPDAAIQSMSLVREVERGFPLTALDKLAKAVAPDDAGFVFRVVSRATLMRRRKALTTEPEAASARLSADESARVARLADVWALAREVWGGDEAARAFLFRPHMVLEGRCPIDVVLANEFGRPMVEGILGRLQYGSAV